jgi:hypothetical protein
VSAPRLFRRKDMIELGRSRPLFRALDECSQICQLLLDLATGDTPPAASTRQRVRLSAGLGRCERGQTDPHVWVARGG